MWQVWLEWRRLIMDNIYNLQCIVIYWEEGAWEFLHFVKIVCLKFTVHLNCVFRPNNKTTDYPRSNQAQCSVSETSATGTWSQLNIFIDALCSAVHSWMLTADLLWCWRLTRRPMCKICAGVDRNGATDMKGKLIGKYESSG